MPIRIRPATVADAAALSRFAADTFSETFARDNTPENMARHAAASYSPQRQAAEIADPAGVVLLVEDADGAGGATLAGYAHVTTSPTPAAVTGAEPIEIRRFYVASAWHGRGLARTLMDAALDAARARGARTVWLGVWERNARAIAFYRKHGFEKVGEQTFMLGDDAQTDWVMARQAHTPAATSGASEAARR